MQNVLINYEDTGQECPLNSLAKIALCILFHASASLTIVTWDRLSIAHSDLACMVQVATKLESG